MKATLSTVFFDQPRGRRSGDWKAIIRIGPAYVKHVRLNATTETAAKREARALIKSTNEKAVA